MENLLVEWLSIDGLVLFAIGILAAIFGVMFGAAGFVLLPSLLLVGIPIHAHCRAWRNKRCFFSN